MNVFWVGVVLADESKVGNDLIVGCRDPLVEHRARGCARVLWVQGNDEELAAAVILRLV